MGACAGLAGGAGEEEGLFRCAPASSLAAELAYFDTHGNRDLHELKQSEFAVK